MNNKKEVLKHGDYVGTIEFDLKRGVLYGQILFINDLVTYEAESLPQLEKEFSEAVDDYLDTCRELGREPNKPFKGSLNIRMTPSQHKQAAIASAKEGYRSLNEYICEAISEKVDGHHEIHHHHKVSYVIERESVVPYEFSDREQSNIVAPFGEMKWKTN